MLAWARFFADWDVSVRPAPIVTAFPPCPPSTLIALDEGVVSFGQIRHHGFPFNITGHPAVVIPIGRDSAGLPIGAARRPPLAG